MSSRKPNQSKETNIHDLFNIGLRKASHQTTFITCNFCPRKHPSPDDAAAWAHIEKEHADKIPSDPSKLAEFKKKHLSSSRQERSSKRHADPSSDGQPTSRERLPNQADNSPKPRERSSAHPRTRDLKDGSPRGNSGKAPRKRRLLGSGPSPQASSASGPSEAEYDGARASSFIQTNASQQAATISTERPEAFSPRPRGPTKSLFNPSASQSSQRHMTRADQPLTSQPPQALQVNPNDSPSSNKNNQPSIEPPAGQRGIFSIASLNNNAPPRQVDTRRDERSMSNETTRLILQPITRPISQEQLIAEVKGIYAGLVMVEGKCLQVDANQSQLVKDAPPGQPPRLNSEQYQALIALHRTLLHEHHDFFLASQHPSATAGVKRLAAKYAMPARLWKHGIHSLLELLRTRLPESIEHMLSFIYLAYSMMTLLLETVPAFKGTWIECLGDLARYRMAIVEKDPEDENDSERENIDDESDAEQKQLIQRKNKDTEVRLSRLTAEEVRKKKSRTRRRILNEEERSQWTTVAFEWYVKARNASPEVGRLYHHLAILSQTDETQQLFYYGKALTVSKPFEAARESVLTLFRPAFGQRKWRQGALKVDRAFITMHAVLFTKKELHQFDFEFPHYIRRLKKYIEIKGDAFLESHGLHMSIANANALIDYGRISNPIMRALLDGGEDIVMDESVTAPTPEDLTTFNLALQLFSATIRAVLNSSTDKTILSFVHCTLVFMAHLATSPSAMSIVEKDFPWQPLATTLNSLIQSYSDYPRIVSNSIPMPKDGEGDYKPFREDVALRQLFWADSLYPNSMFEGYDIEREDQFIDNEKHYDKYRSERVLFMGVQLARRVSSLNYCEVEHRFSVPTKNEEHIDADVRQERIVPMDVWSPFAETETETATMQDDVSMESVTSA